jgi:hypothetical protein
MPSSNTGELAVIDACGERLQLGDKLGHVPAAPRTSGRLAARAGASVQPALTSDRFDDGAALFDVVQERGLEGVVAKRLGSRYRPGERGWVKTKNRETWWRYELERDGAIEHGPRHACSF